MHKNICSILIFLSGLACFSQNEASHWYFGGFAGLNFPEDNSNPTVLLDGEIDTFEGSASISDSEGNLLFYTDGVKVYNKNHLLMPNGDELDGNISSTNSAIIVPKPNNPNTYYIFTAAAAENPQDGLKYSEVDMTLDSGLGDITSKNIALFSPITEKLTAIKHASLNEFWLVAHKANNNEFLSYRITENGITSQPVVSAAGISISYSSAGQMKISPDGKKLAITHTNFADEVPIQLFDFNAETGIISNAEDINLPNPNDPAYGVEFSPNSKVLYVAFFKGIAQYNINDIVTDNPYIILSSNTNPSPSSLGGYSGLQLAPNGKIYVADFLNTFLHIIHQPDNLLESCDFEYNGLSLEGNTSGLGLPPFIQSFFFVGFQVDNPCEFINTLFTANLTETYDDILWDFGDGNTSSEENPYHMYNNPGEYEVTLTVNSGNETSTETQTIIVNEIPIVNPNIEIHQCDNNLDGFSSFNLDEILTEISANSENESITFYRSFSDAENQINPIINTTSFINETSSSDEIFARIENSNGCYDFSQITLTVSTTQIPSNITWNFYECDSGLNNNDGITSFDFSTVVFDIENLFPNYEQLIISFYTSINDALLETNEIQDITNFINTESPNLQKIYIRVESALNNNCLGLGQHINLNVISPPQINLLPDEFFLCSNNSIVLTADGGYDAYSWSTGETTQSITVSEAGEYNITVNNNINGIICSASKTINVIESDKAVLIGFDTVDWTANQNTITTLIEGLGNYEFSLDGITYQDSNIFTNLPPEEFTVYIRDKNGCGIVSGSTYLLSYPKFFTPNGDGQNDFWQIKNSFREPLNEVSIFDRYGKLITTLNSNSIGWDGSYNGNKLPTSDYWFILKRYNGKTYLGHFTLRR